MNTAKCAKGCQVPATTTTTADSIITNKNIVGIAGCQVTSIDTTTVTASSWSTAADLMDIYDRSSSPEGPNSTNATMAGSPRGQ